MYKPTSRIEGPQIQTGLSYVSYLGERYLRERDGDFTDTTLSAKLAVTALDTLTLFPERISGMAIDTSDEVSDITLTAMPELGAGRQMSRNKVQFGQLHVSGDNSAPISELVAVKYLHRLAAPRELQASLAVNRRFGENVAFAPLGYVRSEAGKIGYLSRYEHGVVTLDNILWNETASPEQREHAMGFAGLWLASLHNHGIIHGDAQAKNIAYDSSRLPRYPDLEGATDIRHGNLDSQTKRLVDASDLFNPTYMPTTTPDEQSMFIDGYLEHQKKQPHPLTAADILDTIQNIEDQM